MNAIEKTFRSITSRYASSPAMPYWTVLFLDCIFVIQSGLLAYKFVNGTVLTLSIIKNLLLTLLMYMVCYLAGFRIFRTYAGILRFSSFVDLQKVAISAIAGLGLTIAVQFFIKNGLHDQHKGEWPIYLSPSVLLLQAFMTTILMWGARIWGKMLYESYTRVNRHLRVFIYGPGDGGVSIAKDFNNRADCPYLVVGFVSDTEDLVGKILLGKKVYANDKELPRVMKSMRANTLVVSPLKIGNLRNREDMVNRLIDAGIKILFFPNVQEWDGKSDLRQSQLREINAEELLPRDKIEVDMDQIGEMLEGRRILITGAAGSIGSEIVRLVSMFEPGEMILIDQAETPLHDIRLMMAKRWPWVRAHTIVSDISNRERMEGIYAKYRPEYVFHAAAYKHVPMMEDNPSESIINNVEGTKIIADLSVKYGTDKFVMVSTDKAVNPTNVMGCSKRICEIYVQSLDKAIKEGNVEGRTQFVTTRFGNVLGSNGSVIPIFKEQIKAGGPVTVTHPDIIRFFMLIPEACKLVLEAGTMGKGGEIFVFDMGKPVRIADLAKRMISLSGAKDIEIKYTGLRDGEKLYEEVLSDEELTKPTIHPKIMIATVRQYNFEAIDKEINELIAMGCGDAMDIVRKMKSIVPEFKSRHSVYEVLDRG